MAAKLCCVCGKHLGDHRQRRKLHSDATKHVLPTLVHTLSVHVAGIDGAGTVSEDAILQLLPHESSYICKTPCFSSLEKLIKLRQETRNVEELVLSKLSQCGTYHQLISATRSPIVSEAVPETSARVGSPPRISAPAAKRPCCASSLTPRLSRPVSRQVLFAEQQPVTTPGVTVSYKHLYKLISIYNIG